jgi:phage/plasmid-like protein (TIGR03299 family)
MNAVVRMNRPNAPWMETGQYVEGAKSPFEMLEMSGLNWGVEKKRLFMEDGTESKYSAALVRSDGEHLSDVTPDWCPVQNEEAFEFFDHYVKAGEMVMESAGSFKGGRWVWALARTNDKFALFKEDETQNYLLFVNPHVYGNSLHVGMTAIRISCFNSLMMAISGKNSAKMVPLNHRKPFDPEAARKLLNAAHEQFLAYKEKAEFLASRKFTGETVIDYFNNVFPITGRNKTITDQERVSMSKHATAAVNVLHTQPGAEYGQGTWWQAFNAITYLTDHHMSKTTDVRMYNSWIGDVKDAKIGALNLALDYAEMAAAA